MNSVIRTIKTKIIMMDTCASHVLRFAILNHVADAAFIAPASYERYTAQSPTWAAVKDHVRSIESPEATVTAALVPAFGAVPVCLRHENAAPPTPLPIGRFCNATELQNMTVDGKDAV